MSSCQRDNTIILVPCYKALEIPTQEGILELQSKGWTVEVKYGHSAVDQARNVMASSALQRGYENTFWIDSDIAFTYRDFSMVAESPDRFVCAPYMIKAMQGIIAVMGPEDYTRETRGVKQVLAAGFGFMKVHRSIYTSMIDSGVMPTCQNAPNSQPFWPFFQPFVTEIDGFNKYYGEDYSFCIRANQHKHKLWCNFDTRVRHVGSYAFDWRTDSAQVTVAKTDIRRMGG